MSATVAARKKPTGKKAAAAVPVPAKERDPFAVFGRRTTTAAPKLTALDKKVASVTAITPGSHQDNLFVSLLEAYSPSEATIQKRVEVGGQSHAIVLKQKSFLDDTLTIQKRNYQIAVASKNKQQAIACAKQIAAIEARLKQLEPLTAQLDDLSSVVGNAKVQEETANAIAFYGSAIKHFTAKVDEDDVVDKLVEIKEQADDLDNKGGAMGQPTTELLREVESMEDDIEARVTRDIDQLEEEKTMDQFAAARLPSSAASLHTATRSDATKIKDNKKRVLTTEGSSGGTGELLFPERQTSTRAPTPSSPPPLSLVLSLPSVPSTPISPISRSPSPEIPLVRKEKKKHKKHKGDGKKKASSASKRSSPPEFFRDADNPAAGLSDDVCDDLLDDEDDIVFNYGK